MARSRPQHSFDEEAPLLPHKHKKTTPLPWSQLAILLCLQVTEPLTAQIINPFVSELVRGVSVTATDESQIAFYVGLLQSAFFAAQTLTILRWSRLADQVGRRPVIMIAASGIAVSMILFGLSKSYVGVMTSRSLTGAVNGYIGVVKSMMAEVTDPTNAAQAFALMPIAWSVGATLGPLVGGQLAHPYERFPGVFGGWRFLKEFPYLGAVGVLAVVASVGAVLAYFYLSETNPTKIIEPEEKSKSSSKSPAIIPSILTPPVILATANYALLSLLDISYRSVRPTFFASPPLSLTPPVLGSILALGGLANAVFQITCFAKVHRRFGTKRLYLAAVPCAMGAFCGFPVMKAVAERWGVGWGVWCVFACQVSCWVLFSMTGGCIFIFVVSSAPSRRSIGSVNGVAQMAVSITRTVGPSMVNTFFSLSLKHNYLGGNLVWVVLVCLVGVAFCGGFMLPCETMTSDEDDEC